MWEERDRERRLPKVLRSGQALTPMYTQKPHKWHPSQPCMRIPLGSTVCTHHTTQHHTISHYNQEGSTQLVLPLPMHCTIRGCVKCIKLGIHCRHIRTYTKLPDLLTVEQLQLTVESQLKTPIDNVHWCGPTTKSCVECLLWNRHMHLSKHKGQTNQSQGR